MTPQRKRTRPAGFTPNLKVVRSQTMTNNYETRDTVTEIVTPFDRDRDGTTYKWSEIQTHLGLDSNVANARWFPTKIAPLFQDLGTPELLGDRGRPTKFCAVWLSRYKSFVIDDKNDYETFVTEVKKLFSGASDDDVKASPVEVLGFGDSDDTIHYATRHGSSSNSAIARLETEINDTEDDLAGLVARAIQSKQRANSAIAKLGNLQEKSWQQQIVEDELAKIAVENEKKAQEAQIRLQVRQMVESRSQPDD